MVRSGSNPGPPGSKVHAPNYFSALFLERLKLGYCACCTSARLEPLNRDYWRLYLQMLKPWLVGKQEHTGQAGHRSWRTTQPTRSSMMPLRSSLVRKAQWVGYVITWGRWTLSRKRWTTTRAKEQNTVTGDRPQMAEMVIKNVAQRGQVLLSRPWALSAIR